MDFKRRRKSPAWTYMDQTTSTTVTCLLCKNSFSYSGSTTGMTRHLRTKHPMEYSGLSIERPDSPPQPGPSQPAEPGPSQPAEPGSSTPTVISVPSAAPPRLVQRQQTLENIITRRQAYPDGSAKKKHIDLHLLKMIATDMQPISIVENEGFKTFVKVLDSRYLLPSRRELMRTHFPSLYENQVQQVRTELESASYVTLTSDLWTSRQTKSFVSVTCHFISPEWELKSMLLATKRLMVDHTSQNIADALTEICEEWNVKEKVYCIVTDNASNMVKAVKDIMKAGHIGCFAHTLNLVVQNAIKNTVEVKEVQDKIKAIVSFFHHSVKASDKLSALQLQQGTERKKLIMDVETRWNSTFHMMERFQEQHQVVTTTLCVLGKGSMCLSSDELETVKKSISVLQPFELATKELSSEKVTCLSKVIPMIKALRCCMSSRDNTERRELYTTFPLGKELRTLLDRKFGTLENNFLLGAATLLDPRFKKLPFVDQGNLASIQDRLLSSMRKESDSQMQRESASQVVSSQVAQTSTDTTDRQLDLWREHDETVKKRLKAVPPCVGGNVDMRRYLEEPIIPRDQDPLCWWKEHAPLLPLLQDQVKKILCIPATSVPSERVFSRAGELISERRSCLSDGNVNMLLFLNKNMK